MKHASKWRQWEYLMRRCNPRCHPKMRARLVEIGRRMFEENHRRSLALRETWPTQSIGGAPTRVKFTKADLKRWSNMRDDQGRISVRDHDKPAKRKRDYKGTLRELIAWLEGESANDAILEHAKELVA